MKFIPLSTFEVINSVLQQVEAQGCLVTIRLEAFTCRMQREEKQLAATVAEKRRSGSSNQVSPLLQPQAGQHCYHHGSTGLPPLAGGDDGGRPGLMFSLPTAVTTGSSCCAAVVGLEGHGEEDAPAAAAAVDERFVYLIAAMNAVHGDGDYDFSVVDQQDFVLLDGGTAMLNEVNHILMAMPESCLSAIGINNSNMATCDAFWGAIGEQVVGAPTAGKNNSSGVPLRSPASVWLSECDVFQFCNPSCDPLYARSIWSSHYFIYSRRQRIIVSMMCLGEGNMYRGDDQGYYSNHVSSPGPASSRHHKRRRRGDDDDEGEGEYYHDGEKTTFFYASGAENSNKSQPVTTDDEAAGGGEEAQWEDDGGDEGGLYAHKNRAFYGY